VCVRRHGKGEVGGGRGRRACGAPRCAVSGSCAESCGRGPCASAAGGRSSGCRARRRCQAGACVAEVMGREEAGERGTGRRRGGVQRRAASGCCADSRAAGCDKRTWVRLMARAACKLGACPLTKMAKAKAKVVGEEGGGWEGAQAHARPYHVTAGAKGMRMGSPSAVGAGGTARRRTCTGGGCVRGGGRGRPDNGPSPVLLPHLGSRRRGRSRRSVGRDKGEAERWSRI
jgi:hypothetical protein